MTRSWISRALAAGVLVAAAAGSRADGPDDRPFPRFSDGVARPPADVLTGSPFDMGRVFEAVPREKNAAPLYLDALAEFGAEVAACFPPGPERERRTGLVRGRDTLFRSVQDSVDKDPASVPAESIDAAVAQYDEGFRKLADAQKLDLCVFETGVGPTALLPHVQAARTVARVAALKVRREVARGELAAAADDVRTVLRLGRDLRRRGFIITELVEAAMTTVTVNQAALPTLAATGLTPAHCDRLIAALLDGEAKGVDPYAETLASEYVNVRLLLRDLVADQGNLARAFNVPSGKVIEAVVNSLGAGDRSAVVARLPEDADARVAGATAADVNRVAERTNRYFRALLDLKDRPRSEQIEHLPPADLYFPGDEPMNVAIRETMAVNLPNVIAVIGRAEASVRAAACLAAVRRWQLTHNGSVPDDLAAACEAAGLKAVPLDPFDGKPMKLETFEGRPAVYSVGKDGNDDGARLDSNLDRLPGDLIFQVPAR